jgi:hypothetical protein
MADTRSHARKTFLRGSDVEREAKELRVAVAYWGGGSVDRLDIKSVAGNDTTIVCDLMSGACNPIEIECLQKAFQKPSCCRRESGTSTASPATRRLFWRLTLLGAPLPQCLECCHDSHTAVVSARLEHVAQVTLDPRRVNDV